MVAASNTSPISNLAIVGRLDLLRFQFGNVLIPEAVRSELSSIPLAEAKSRVDAAIGAGWIKAVQIRNPPLAAMLELTLDRGESEAIALAVELQADYLLMDEKQGRVAARRADIRVTGVLGILLAAKKAGGVGSLKREIRVLRDDAGFFVDAELEARVLQAAGE